MPHSPGNNSKTGGLVSPLISISILYLSSRATIFHGSSLSFGNAPWPVRFTQPSHYRAKNRTRSLQGSERFPTFGVAARFKKILGGCNRLRFPIVLSLKRER